MNNMKLVEKFSSYSLNDQEYILSKWSKIIDMERIIKNKRMDRLFSRVKCDKYTSIDSVAMNRDDEKIIVYFSELEIYGAFLPKDYIEFAKKILEMKDDGENIDFNPKQIVFSNQSQKIFMIYSGDRFEALKKYIKEFFNADINIHHNSESEIEIMIQNPIANDYQHMRELFQKFQDYVYKQDPNMLPGIKEVQTFAIGNQRRIGVNIEPSLDNVNDLLKLLSHIPPGSIINNLTVIMGNQTNNFNSTKVDVDKITIDWINKNPPEENEPTSSYYDKYKKHMLSIDNTPQIIQKFTKNVSSLNYKKLHGKINYWVKK